VKKLNVKNISIKLIAAAVLLNLYSQTTPMLPPAMQEKVLNKQFNNNSPACMSAVLNRIFERKPLYEKIAESYSEKFIKAGFDYSKKDILDMTVAMEYIESRGEINAISKAGAEGLKQLMPYTAKDYGLINNKYLNESFNPVKATIASLEYILRYAKAYASIDLALLCYNAGPGTVERILKQYPDVRRKHEFPKELLNEESNNYVNKFYFIHKRIKEPEKYGISINPAKLKFKEYKTKKGDNLIKIAKKYHSSEDLIAQYNGIKNKSRIPVNYSLLIPQRK
jgi:soluble lytic murein transglycosylase-like protein